MLEIQLEVLPKSPEGRAVRYALKNWTALTRYAEDGNLDIDNNRTERKDSRHSSWPNQLGVFGSDKGGRTAAVLRRFAASAERAGVDPFAWFKGVLARIAEHPITRLAELLPRNWRTDIIPTNQIAPRWRCRGDSRTLTIFPAYGEKWFPAL